MFATIDPHNDKVCMNFVFSYTKAQKNAFGTALTGGRRAEEAKPFNSVMGFKRNVSPTSFLKFQVRRL
jgi:hypothetical protein